MNYNIPNVTAYEDKKWKKFYSSDYNVEFNKITGKMKRWGKTEEDDPVLSPWGPELIDIELVVDGCNGVGNGPCKFCAPKGEYINTPVGIIEIQDIKIGDSVYGYDGKTVVENLVVETYSREYIGKLILIELEDGSIIKLTPEHKIFTKRGLIMACNINSLDDIITIY